MGLLQRLFRRETPPETSCPRCGVPAPGGTIECSACGWDLRDSYHDPLEPPADDAGQDAGAPSTGRR
jgi:hypothetical protein